MDDAIRYAKKFTEDLLSFFGLNTDVKASHEDDVIEISIPSTYLNGFLIGQHGDTLRSVQYLISAALKNQKFEYYRVNLDVADYKRHRQDRLAAQTERWVADVRGSGKPMELNPMNAADRRIVHKVVGEYSDVSTESLGEGRDRHVVISPELAPGTEHQAPEDEEKAEEVTEEKPEEETAKAKKAKKPKTTKEPKKPKKPAKPKKPKKPTKSTK